MAALDLLAHLVHRLLSVFPDEMHAVLWLPVLYILVFVILHLFVRHVAPWLGGVVASLLGQLAVTVGAVMLLPDLLTASLFRWFRRRPPTAVYAYGDAVASGVIVLGSTTRHVSTGFNRTARLGAVPILVVALALMWMWDRGYCEDEPACLRPFTQWTAALPE
jgi:hypothetical protein